MVGKKHLKTIEPFFTILIWLTELYAYYVKFIIIKMLNNSVGPCSTVASFGLDLLATQAKN
jgi:hypothetical protein